MCHEHEKEPDEENTEDESTEEERPPLNWEEPDPETPVPEEPDLSADIIPEVQTPPEPGLPFHVEPNCCMFFDAMGYGGAKLNLCHNGEDIVETNFVDHEFYGISAFACGHSVAFDICLD